MLLPLLLEEVLLFLTGTPSDQKKMSDDLVQLCTKSSNTSSPIEGIITCAYHHLYGLRLCGHHVGLIVPAARVHIQPLTPSHI
jgi:hypothetical protein